MVTVEIGKKINYTNLLYIIPDTFYYCIDTNEVFRGENPSSQIIRIVAVESPSPHQGVMYVINGAVKAYNGYNYEELGSAYIMGTTEPYTTDVAITAMSINSASPTSVINSSEEGLSEPQEPITIDYQTSFMNDQAASAYAAEISDTVLSEENTQIVETPRFSTTGISNIRSWTPIEPDNVVDPSVGESVSLESYYEDVNYVATPLTYSTFGSSAIAAAPTAEEEITAIDYSTFARLTGTSGVGVISVTASSSDTDTATTAYVAAQIAVATQQIQEYINGLTMQYDPLGAADVALAKAKAYVDRRLTWKRFGGS